MYARALFEAAREAGRVDDVAGDLAALASAIDEVPELRAFLRNPQIEPAGKAAVLEQLAAGADELV
jgi:F0F1-type ATP synthase delta subunit